MLCLFVGGCANGEIKDIDIDRFPVYCASPLGKIKVFTDQWPCDMTDTIEIHYYNQLKINNCGMMEYIYYHDVLSPEQVLSMISRGYSTMTAEIKELREKVEIYEAVLGALEI